MTVSTKIVIEVGKSKKLTFSFKADFVHFFVKRLIFWQHQRGAAVNLILVLQFVFDDLQHLLISLARGLNIFTMLNYFTHLTSFKQVGSSIEQT